MLPGIGWRTLRAALGLMLLACATLVAAQQDQGESPYFAVEGGDGVVDALPLKSTDVQVRILGVMADVRVVQRYRNEGWRRATCSPARPARPCTA